VSEVAGIPGRIIEVRGKARAFMEPEFGSSYHLAKVLLAAMEKDGEVRSVANIKYDNTVDEALRKLGLSVVGFDRANLPKEALESDVVAAWGVRQTVEEFSGVPDVIVDRGEHGIEPVSYVFGESAVKAAGKAIQIAKALGP
ncbi:MAG: thiamine-phosphate synthase family protein, partial [Candidatus Bathyarchaeia archaeon]